MAKSKAKSAPRTKQLTIFPRGGSRPGAGRKPKGERALVTHSTRPTTTARNPVLITTRLVAGVPNLRRERTLVLLRDALASGADRFGFRLVEYSIQSNHLHFVAELRASVTHEHASRRVLVPVPLHFVRRFERGYDQAWLLARACAEEAGLPALRVLRRVRATPVQGALGTSSRAANVRGAFAPSLTSRWTARRIAGADVWLVDDVLTSGSTAAECARILRRLGARSVSVLCVARP